MAFVGLELGEKVTFVDKEYRDITPALANVDELLGKLTLVSQAENDVIYRDDLSQPRGVDGRYPQTTDGEIRWAKVGLLSDTQDDLDVSILNQTKEDIDALDLKFGDEVVLTGVHIVYVSIGRNRFKVIAESIVKKQGQNQRPKQPEHKEQN